jgi:hypothetical protein
MLKDEIDKKKNQFKKKCPKKATCINMGSPVIHNPIWNDKIEKKIN